MDPIAMTMNLRFARWLLIASLLLVLPAAFSRAADAEGPPNIVFLLADDLGRADCGFMGGSEIDTPHIDALAAGGAILDAHYVQPLCSPTRAALMTGRYPMRQGLQVGVCKPWAKYGLPLNERLLSQALGEAGYATGVFGKWHLGFITPEYLPTHRGFDRQYGHYNGALDSFTHMRDGGFDWHSDDHVCRDKGYSSKLVAREAAKFIAEHAGKRPFFAYVPFNAVHTPLQAPPRYIQQYAHLKGERAKYAAMLTAMDDAVGQIIAAVDDAGVRDNTLIVFSSDNGGPDPGRVTDNGDYRGGKGSLYEGGVRVAACAAWDGRIKAGSTIDGAMHAVDWYPTFVELAGGKLDQELPVDGRDVWPMLTTGAPSPHDAILLNTTPVTGAVRVGDWKLIAREGEDNHESGVSKRSRRPAYELFNLKDDPYEKSNLADEQPAKVKELESTLAQFAAQAVEPKAQPKPKNFVVPAVWGDHSQTKRTPEDAS
jgi:arylsulfatase A-like enzyme